MAHVRPLVVAGWRSVMMVHVVMVVVKLVEEMVVEVRAALRGSMDAGAFHACF